ncbi:hypothetical protein QBC45DRAFT_413289 [Copromyces sp. CBS 386.78]|nr:hypothetical protein QBC45DRAFT_413289 [Copromyces sp. CBS 386.78]
MHFSHFLLPLSALLATATAAPYTIEEDAFFLNPTLYDPSSPDPYDPSSHPDPYNTTLPDPSLYPNPRDLSPTPILDTRNPSPVAADYNGATPNRDQAKYNGPYTYTSHFCGAPRMWADLSAIQDGQGYLNGLGGKPKIKAGTCSRVSCSYWSAIWVCNDNNKDIELQSFRSITQAAAFLSGACFKYVGDRNRIGGQVYFGEKFSVAITVNKC